MKKKNNNWTTAFLVLLLLAGVSLLLYPSLSDYWNSMHQTRAIASYAETVSQLDTAQYDEMWKAAQDYNRSLAQRETAFALTDEQKTEQLIDARQAVDALRDDPDAMQQLAAYALQIAAERHV